MKLRPIAGIVLRQMYLMRTSPARILPMFAWVAIDIVLWGFLTRYLNSVTAARVDFVPMLLGAVLMWDFFQRIMHGVTTAFFEDLWARNFLSLFATPLTRAEYVTGLVITSMLTSVIGLVVMLVLATAVFGLSFFTYGALLVPFLLLLFLFGVTFGILGCALVLRMGPASEWLIWPIPALLSPFVGVFYPMSVLPGWMQSLGWLMPPSYVFEGMRAVVSGGPFDARGLAFGSALAVVEMLLAGWVFARVYRHAVRTGLLARYSAESVS